MTNAQSFLQRGGRSEEGDIGGGRGRPPSPLRPPPVSSCQVSEVKDSRSLSSDDERKDAAAAAGTVEMKKMLLAPRSPGIYDVCSRVYAPAIQEGGEDDDDDRLG